MKILRLALPIVLFVLLWEFISRIGIVSSSLFPPPSKVILALMGMIRSGELFVDVIASYKRLILGFTAGAVVGVIIGITTGRLNWLSSIIVPLIHILRPLPPVAIIPLVIVWFGIGEFAKVFSIAFAVFFPVWLNTFLGTQQIPQKLLWCAQTLTSSRFKIFCQVIFPSALPFIVAGLRNAIAVSFVMVFVAELAGASSGIGYQISISHLAYKIDNMMASLLVLGVSGALADWLFYEGILKIFPWLKHLKN